MPEIGFGIPSQGIPTLNMQGADMRSPTADNAIPSVMPLKFVGDASGKIFICFSPLGPFGIKRLQPG